MLRWNSLNNPYAESKEDHQQNSKHLTIVTDSSMASQAAKQTVPYKFKEDSKNRLGERNFSKFLMHHETPNYVYF